jgi:hypothetical protein
MGMDRFVAHQNIKRFRNRLVSETDARGRARLHQLLIAEEDKLGHDLELLANVEQAITNFAALVETQKELVRVLESNKLEDASGARALLDGLEHSHLPHKNYYQRMVACFERHL